MMLKIEKKRLQRQCEMIKRQIERMSNRSFSQLNIMQGTLTEGEG